VKISLSTLKDTYTGKAAAVLGGGPSLVADLRRLPKGCLLIAVNQHALYYRKATYMVYNDRPEDGAGLAQAIREHKAILVSPDPTSDIEFDVPVWTGFYSSNTAAWFALYLGCNPVILCGMDLYQGKQVYCHPVDHDEPQWHYPLEHHLRPWVEEGKNLLPHVERLKAMSGPLVNVFGKYNKEIASAKDASQ
jgi:hypothetical protein